MKSRDPNTKDRSGLDPAEQKEYDRRLAIVRDRSNKGSKTPVQRPQPGKVQPGKGQPVDEWMKRNDPKPEAQKPQGPQNLDDAAGRLQILNDYMKSVVSPLAQNPKHGEAYQVLAPYLTILNQPVAETGESVNANYMMLLQVQKFLATAFRKEPTNPTIPKISKYLAEKLQEIYKVINPK